MAEKVILNKRWTISWRNAFNGVAIAAITSGLTALQQLLDANGVISYKIILTASLSGGVGYILKKWLLDKPSVVTQYNSNVKAEQVAETIADENKA